MPWGEGDKQLVKVGNYVYTDFRGRRMISSKPTLAI